MSPPLRNGPVCQVHGCGKPSKVTKPGQGRKDYYRPFCGRHWYVYQMIGAVTIIRESDPL